MMAVQVGRVFYHFGVIPLYVFLGGFSENSKIPALPALCHPPKQAATSHP